MLADSGITISCAVIVQFSVHARRNKDNPGVFESLITKSLQKKIRREISRVDLDIKNNIKTGNSFSLKGIIVG